MKITAHSRAHRSSAIIALSLLPVIATFCWSTEPDPTTPSPLIVKQMALDDEAVPEVEPTDSVASRSLPLHGLRLRAIVLRDRDNGTALVSLGDSKLYVVPLRRSILYAKANRLSILGRRLAIKDFSDSSIVVYDRTTNDQFIID